MLGIIGLLLAIALLIIGSYKGFGPLPMTIMAAIVVIVTNGLGLWGSLSGPYMSGYAGTYTGNFLIFIFSALYAKFMDESGSASAIGYKLIDWFGKKRVMLVSILIISILTYGGVSVFVCIFACAPIMFTLLREANLPRHLSFAYFVAGACTYTMTSLPGTPQLTNIIPTRYLGTSMTAAPALGIFASVILFAASYVYCMYQEKRAIRKGEVWTEPETSLAQHVAVDRTTLPEAWKAFVPVIVLIGMIVIGAKFTTNSAMLTVISMLAASVICYFLNFDKFKNVNLPAMLTAGLGGGITAIGGLAAVVAFGTVVKQTIAYQDIVDWLLALDMHPYVKGTFATAVISGITGSSSGGLTLVYESLTPYFVESGCNLDTLHRLMAIAAGSLDTLPHSSGCFLVLSYLGLNHKNAYYHEFWISVIFPAILTVILTAGCIMIGL